MLASIGTTKVVPCYKAHTESSFSAACLAPEGSSSASRTFTQTLNNSFFRRISLPTYLVTGAAGFIGRSIAAALLARGDSVRGIDSLITGKRSNLAGLALPVQPD